MTSPTGRIPLIGLSTYAVEASWGSWKVPASVVPAAYYELVAAAGGRPLLLPPTRRSPDGPGQGAAEVVEILDGLVLIGGGDLDPAAYGQTPLQTTNTVDADRDRSEISLLSAALTRDLPVLAVCRGHQVLNVALGGTLVQHLPDAVGHAVHQPAPGCFGDVEVATEPGSLVAKVLGERTAVKCCHHQAIDRLGEGLIVSARSADPDDGVIEAVELPGRPFVVGVQWHPEESDDSRLFEALLSACTRQR